MQCLILNKTVIQNPNIMHALKQRKQATTIPQKHSVSSLFHKTGNQNNSKNLLCLTKQDKFEHLVFKSQLKLQHLP